MKAMLEMFSSVKKQLTTHKAKRCFGNVFFGSLLLSVCGFVVAAQDELASLKPVLSGTFGVGSVVYNSILVLEALSSVYIFHKSKNPAHFLGIPAVLIILTWSLNQFLGT